MFIMKWKCDLLLLAGIEIHQIPVQRFLEGPVIHKDVPPLSSRSHGKYKESDKDTVQTIELPVISVGSNLCPDRERRVGGGGFCLSVRMWCEFIDKEQHRESYGMHKSPLALSSKN